MKNWFEIDCQGWKRVNAGRPVGHLIREAISNSFDEETVTEVTVALRPGYLRVEDNGQRNQDVNMLFTIFMTDKKDSHLKRGRKGRGLKELLSVADKAQIETIGNTITFDQNGRNVAENTRSIGTIIEIHTDQWGSKDCVKAIKYLGKIIPPKQIKFVVNDQQILPPTHRKSHPDILPTTIIRDEVEKSFEATATVSLYELREDESIGWIHEMGIPIQKVPIDFHIDVGQRVPMNDNRDVIADEYKKKLYGGILDKGGTYEQPIAFTQEMVKMSWVHDGLEEAGIKTKRAVAQFVSDGGRRVLKSNKLADDVAKQNGYKIIDTTLIPLALQETLRWHVQTSIEVADEIEKEDRQDMTDWTDEMKNFAEVMTWLGKYVVKKPMTVQFYLKPTNHKKVTEYANFQVGNKVNFLRFNAHPDAKIDFGKPLSPQNIDHLAHELAHNWATYHDENFVDSLSKVAGLLVYTILLKRQEFERRFGTPRFMPGKTCMINCVDCGIQREIKVQDRFQCVRCTSCQEKIKRDKKRTSKTTKEMG